MVKDDVVGMVKDDDLLPQQVVLRKIRVTISDNVRVHGGKAVLNEG